MIYDRTNADINNAKQILKRLKQGETLTQSDIDTLERGTLTYNTLNRIEEKQREVAEKLRTLNYVIDETEHKIWSKEDIFKKSDLERLVNYTINFRKAYSVLDESQRNPTARFHFENFNAIEKILEEIEQMFEIGKLSIKRSNDFFAGQEVVLPL